MRPIADLPDEKTLMNAAALAYFIDVPADCRPPRAGTS